ncbi:complex proteins associated with Set1p component shg1-domain-containing protein [Yarrowia lipolytica]|jgi:hypothetical protein|uniref:YALI0B21164p n=2 Tax=Yarrowia lipolytica TaxID=4952 RepID=Q6CDU3_YARLI|nr:YALI0B21164p [Yarrowia lipolytica CLIB122]AOW02014.1 hypothetical protein YALI1_B27570g [Yarrowia lipolytica]KAB8283407.1 complex proteins associated with Set1p component shg1-domain-containing protein [Yarrowia lipolytica]KAE8173360.1 complex proteins associated with Set1p component shg1-domain-containing protein [Yarrowia lipolytica]KAJ8052784.1 complex proteins associated with Set1p component shg1-domain-containing protein [Yarrowia lipolytica]QNP96905.1 Hypothetical protein YALI2_C00558|eukprot:XP_501169.1 YALI0B21164p [Yarrowia lipolytica CLIB122]
MTDARKLVEEFRRSGKFDEMRRDALAKFKQSDLHGDIRQQIQEIVDKEIESQPQVLSRGRGKSAALIEGAINRNSGKDSVYTKVDGYVDGAIDQSLEKKIQDALQGMVGGEEKTETKTETKAEIQDHSVSEFPAAKTENAAESKPSNEPLADTKPEPSADVSMTE